VRQEWARTIRTTVQVTLGLIPALPALVDALGLNATAGVGASILATSAVLTRLMQVPVVDRLVQRILRSQ